MEPWLTMTLARIRSVVLDCPDPRSLAAFYGAVVGGELTVVEDDWVVLTVDGLRLAFQLADEFVPPTWPTGERPQQFHLDLTVDDVDAVEAEVLALGATKHAVQPGQATGDTFRVYLDPAGHPFCLCWD
jgi:catechol 2,3-dioxygenase-like lactoylglutathione lyase family enzyme